jgi:hypothetical protein
MKEGRGGRGEREGGGERERKRRFVMVAPERRLLTSDWLTDCLSGWLAGEQFERKRTCTM